MNYRQLRRRLRELGCGYGQGYLLARPLSADMAEAWLADERATAELGDFEAIRIPRESDFASVTIH